MGWCSGDDLCASIWEMFKPHLPKEHKISMLKKLIVLFEAYDMDCYDSIMESEEGKEALKEMKPSWFEDD